MLQADTGSSQGSWNIPLADAAGPNPTSPWSLCSAMAWGLTQQQGSILAGRAFSFQVKLIYTQYLQARPERSTAPRVGIRRDLVTLGDKEQHAHFFIIH